MYKNHTPTPKSSKLRRKLVVLGIMAAIALIGATGVYKLNNHRNLQKAQQAAAEQSAKDANINFNPPTSEEKEAANQQKEETASKNEQTQTATPSPITNNKKSVKPIVASAAEGRAYGLIPGIVETTGTCTATFTSGNSKVTLESSVFADAQSTRCNPIDYSSTQVNAGWSIIITYQSPTSEGVSDEQKTE